MTAASVFLAESAGPAALIRLLSERCADALRPDFLRPATDTAGAGVFAPSDSASAAVSGGAGSSAFRFEPRFFPGDFALPRRFGASDKAAAGAGVVGGTGSDAAAAEAALSLSDAALTAAPPPPPPPPPPAFSSPESCTGSPAFNTGGCDAYTRRQYTHATLRPSASFWVFLQHKKTHSDVREVGAKRNNRSARNLPLFVTVLMQCFATADLPITLVNFISHDLRLLTLQYTVASRSAPASTSGSKQIPQELWHDICRRED